MIEIDPKAYSGKFLSKSSLDAAAETRIITWEDDRRVVIDTNGTGLRSIKRFGSTEGATIRVPGKVLVTGNETNWDLMIDPASYYYAASLDEPAYAAMVPSTEYSAMLASENATISLAWELEASTATYSTRIEPDFEAASDYTLTLTAPDNAGIIATVGLTKFLLENYVYLAMMTYDGAWTMLDNVASYVEAGGLSIYKENNIARIAFITHPAANSYDEYPFILSTSYVPQNMDISSIILAPSQTEELTISFSENNSTTMATYEACVVDLYKYGEYAFPAGNSYTVEFKRTSWSYDNNSVWASELSTFASCPVGIETQYAVP